LTGGHVIQLGPGNKEAANAALKAWQGGLQIGGGINADNAAEWLAAGASHVIVTSWLFDQEGKFLEENLRKLADEIGKEHIVVDLSCRKTATGWTVAMDRWQTLTDLDVTVETLDRLAEEPHVVLDLSETYLVDHTTMAKLHEMEKEFKERQSTLVITGLEKHQPLSSHPEAGRKKPKDSFKLSVKS
ncbi:MAG: HisA/HisF-related TIM barrel protein, partial [Nitrospirales bacterium]